MNSDIQDFSPQKPGSRVPKGWKITPNLSKLVNSVQRRLYNAEIMKKLRTIQFYGPQINFCHFDLYPHIGQRGDFPPQNPERTNIVEKGVLFTVPNHINSKINHSD